MANLVSIEWSVEEFRRLISAQSESSDGAQSTQKAVDILDLEIQPSPATVDPVPIRGHAGLLEVGTASEALPSIVAAEVVTQQDKFPDLIVAEVLALTASQASCSDEPVSSRDADRVRDIALHILHPEVYQPSEIVVGNAGYTASSEIEIAALADAEDQLTNSAATVEPEIQEAPARLVGAEVRNLQLLPSQEPVVEPDLLTQRVDCARAIELRWVLRDIRSNRIKWSPPCETDLKILIELDLVTMSNGLPHLTPSGLSAIG